MKNMDVCLRLLAAESEAEVQTVITETAEMANPKNWRPLDGRETNFNVTSNQASDGGKALTELMTNMVDAVLLKYAYLKDVDPKGRGAPTTMYAAVHKLIRPLKGGKLVNIDPADPWLREFAQKNLVIGVTGAKSKRSGFPCYTFVDNGEGQNPENFEDTFLSLSAGNKKDIRFVQGKYNMGSSGVLSYCGLKWFKLIVSRRYDKKGPWGFTLMRRRPRNGMPVAEYFVLPNGTIPKFQADTLFPFSKNNGKRDDGVHISSGTAIKLYDYQTGSRFSGFKGAREALNENLVETILPFRILDFRQTPDPKRGGDRAEGIDPRPFYGMEFLLLRSHREDEKDEDEDDAAGTGKIAVANIQDPELGHIGITAIPLKRTLPGWLQKSNNRVFHALNGQVQFKQTRGYISQSCGFPALKDRIVIVVDASNLTFAAHNDVWKGDREHIRNTIVGERYKDLVTAAIAESKALQNLQNQIAREELDLAAKSERNELFQKLVDADRNLAALLSDRDPVIVLPSAGGEGGNDAGGGQFEGKYSPTFLRLEEKIQEVGLRLPINRARPVAARTDAENGYLQRADNRGQLLLPVAVKDKFSTRVQLHNGRLTVYFEAKKGYVKVGDTFEATIGLHDFSMAKPVEDKLTIRIVEEDVGEKTQRKNEGNGKIASGPEGKRDGQGRPAPTHGLPRYMLLTKDGRMVGDQETQPWPADFSEHDGGIIQDFGHEGVLYKINYDNSYHIRYRQQQRGDVARDVVTEKYILGMRILMLGYEHAFRVMKERKSGGAPGFSEETNGFAEHADEFRRMAARGAAATVLALAENLPKIVDRSAMSAQEVE